MENIIKQIDYLKQKLAVVPSLEVNHSGFVWQASFEWFTPATSETISEVEAQLNICLPSDYVAFLAQCTNGAMLFRDVQYGQWGFKLYPIEDLPKKQAFWQDSFQTGWQSEFLVFAEMLGEANALLLDLRNIKENKMACPVVEANAIDSIDEWLVASRSFHEWLDHLMVAQGAKYWEWR